MSIDVLLLRYLFVGVDDDTEPHSDPVPEETSKKKRKKSKKTVPAIKIKIGKKKRGRKKAASVSCPKHFTLLYQHFTI